MKPEPFKILFRIFGSLAALFGLGVLMANVYVFIGASQALGLDHRARTAAFILNAVVSLYLVYVGFQLWFRWSPAAVRHGLWALAVLVFFGLLLLEKHIKMFSKIDLPLVYFISCGVIAFFVYRFSAAYFFRVMFPLDRRQEIPGSGGKI